ncbi:MAG: hypothetical protein JZD40_00940 [Sulfolobus sp.]|nr:hypothetical protein [Sulfolobus sp.]
MEIKYIPEEPVTLEDAKHTMESICELLIYNIGLDKVLVFKTSNDAKKITIYAKYVVAVKYQDNEIWAILSTGDKFHVKYEQKNGWIYFIWDLYNPYPFETL